MKIAVCPGCKKELRPFGMITPTADGQVELCGNCGYLFFFIDKTVRGATTEEVREILKSRIGQRLMEHQKRIRMSV